MSARAGWLPHAADKLALFGAPFLCLMCSFTWWFVRIRPEREPKSLVSRKMSQRLHVQWRAGISLTNDVRRLTENVFWGLKFDGRKESQSTGIDLLCFVSGRICGVSVLWHLGVLWRHQVSVISIEFSWKCMGKLVFFISPAAGPTTQKHAHWPWSTCR